MQSGFQQQVLAQIPHSLNQRPGCRSPPRGYVGLELQWKGLKRPRLLIKTAPWTPFLRF